MRIDPIIKAKLEYVIPIRYPEYPPTVQEWLEGQADKFAKAYESENGVDLVVEGGEVTERAKK